MSYSPDPDDYVKKAHTITASSDHVGRRLDRVVSLDLPGVPKSLIHRWLRKGRLRVNGARSAHNYRLSFGDVISVPAATVQLRTHQASTANQSWAPTILYQDTTMMVLDKPVGLAVHAGSGQAMGLIERLRAQGGEYTSMHLCHRLDKGTSGCLVLAKGLSNLNYINKQFKDRKIEKIYRAIVAPELLNSCAIRHRLRVQRDSNGLKESVVCAQGMVAKTHIEVVRSVTGCTEVNARPETGRLHQIRVHLAHIGHPIVGDERYGHVVYNRLWRRRGCRRLFLHAQSITLQSPAHHRMIQCHSPVPIEFEEAIAMARRLF